MVEASNKTENKNRKKVTNQSTIKTQDIKKRLKVILRSNTIFCKTCNKTFGGNDRTRQLLREKMAWKWTTREEKDFDESKKLITGKPCLAQFARDGDIIVTTDASTTGLGITLRQN